MFHEDGKDIGPDEIHTEGYPRSDDLEMDLSMEGDENVPSTDTVSSQRAPYSLYSTRQVGENNISSMPQSFTERRVYGLNQTVWMPNFEEPLDMSSDLTLLPTRSDAILDTTEDLSSVNGRLRTFESSWPKYSPVSPEDLARNGFYYLGPDDRVKCHFCYGVLKQWTAGDIVEEEHRKHFPECSIHKGQGQINVCVSGSGLMHSDSRGVLPRCNESPEDTEMPIENFGIVTNKPKHPRYAIESDRLATFKLWPSQMKQKPEDLARAGLFYMGKGDRVRCFSCDGQIHSWEPQDEPMSEHARWFPDCAFVKLMSDRSSNNKPEGRNVSDAEQQNHSAAVQALIDSDYSLEVISQAINKLHTERGPSGKNEIPSAQDILLTMMDMESSANQDIGLKQTKQTKMADKDMQLLLDENQELKDQKLCKVCLENEISVIFLPCGHLACCRQCGTALSECPICRSVIKGAAKAYWA